MTFALTFGIAVALLALAFPDTFFHTDDEQA